MQKFMPALMMALFVGAASAEAQSTIGLDVTATPITDLGTSIGVLNPSVNVRIAGPIGVGARVGVKAATFKADTLTLAELKTVALDIPVSAELSQSPRVSAIAFGGPTLFFDRAEALGVKASDSGVGFHFGGDVTVYLTDVVGVGGTVVINRGNDGSGFERYGGGVRFRF